MFCIQHLYVCILPNFAKFQNIVALTANGIYVQVSKNKNHTFYVFAMIEGTSVKLL